MAKQVLGLVATFPFDGAPATTVGQNLIAVVSTVNAGNAVLATAKAPSILGVTTEPTDGQGYASVQLNGIAQIVVGAAAITAGQYVAATAAGQAQGVTVLATGGTLTGIIGNAISSAPAGGLVDVLINPDILLS